MEFPGVLANDDVSLDIRKGEVFALVGENGAGKTTLMNILYGIHEPTNGEVYIRGRKVERFSPKTAISMGVGMVHQHFMLVPSFTVAQNIVMSREPRRLGVLFDNKAAEAAAQKLVEEYGLVVDPAAVVREIGVGLQQRVEILKTLYRGADILILDEPTAVLTPQETDELFAVIRRVVRELGMTVIIITHKLYEVMAISDRVGVMRKGRLIGVENTCDVDEKKLASMMVGRPVLYDRLEKTGEAGAEQIAVHDLTVCDDRGLVAVDRGRGREDELMAVMLAHDLQNGQRGVQIVAVIEQRLFDRFTNSLEPGKVNHAGDVVVCKKLVHRGLITAVGLNKGRALAGDFLNAVNDLWRTVVQIIDDDGILSCVQQ